MITYTATHATLLARMGEGNNHAAWGEFVDRYGELIRGFCKRHNLQTSDTDDVVQDVLVSLARAMPEFQYDPSKGKFRSYLKTVSVHAIYRKIGQKDQAGALGESVSAATASGDPATDAQWEQEWRQYHLRQALATLRMEASARDREVFDRVAVRGEEPARVAQELGLSTDNIYQVKSRLTKRISAIISQQVAEEG